MGRIRVCVIGGGAAGLCAGRNMVHSPHKYSFTIFEQTEEVGGTWNYTENTGVDQHQLPIHSSMYKNLRTNVPKEIMGYPDFPFPDAGCSFTHHSFVLDYLRSYAKKHGLYEHIKFLSFVESVAPETDINGKTTWVVKVTDVKARVTTDYEFDAVMICNGHYAVPNIPPIPGIENYHGRQIHSHNYRDPELFRDKTVIVLGAASSGMDISIEVSTTAKKIEYEDSLIKEIRAFSFALEFVRNEVVQVECYELKLYMIYLSHNLPEKHKCDLPGNVKQVPGIKSAQGTGFQLLDGSSVDADVLLYCTGYLFNFPFLTENCKVRVEGHRVMPLYKHLIHIDFPTLCFVGLPFTVLPFPMFHFQTLYFLKTLDGTISLPSKGEMEEEAEEDFRRRVIDMRMPPKHAHKMGPLQWDYFQSLGNEAHCETLPPVYRMIYDKVDCERKANVMWYKKEDYKMINEQEFIKMPGP